MKKQSETKSQSRNHYSSQFKEEALRRAERDGVPVTARELKLHESQLYAWRARKRLHGQSGEERAITESGG